MNVVQAPFVFLILARFLPFLAVVLGLQTPDILYSIFFSNECGSGSLLLRHSNSRSGKGIVAHK